MSFKSLSLIIRFFELISNEIVAKTEFMVHFFQLYFWHSNLIRKIELVKKKTDNWEAKNDSKLGWKSWFQFVGIKCESQFVWQTVLVFVRDESVESVFNSSLILSHSQLCPEWSKEWYEEKIIWERNHDGIPLGLWLWWNTCK